MGGSAQHPYLGGNTLTCLCHTYTNQTSWNRTISNYGAEDRVGRETSTVIAATVFGGGAGRSSISETAAGKARVGLATAGISRYFA